MTEADGIAAELRFMRKTMETQDKLLLEVAERLREIELTVAEIKAKQKPPMHPWAMSGIMASILATGFVVLDRIYISR